MTSFTHSNSDIVGHFKKKKSVTPRVPVEAPEGIQTGPTTGDLSVSLTKIEVMDLLSDGEVDGLVQGEYIYAGTMGQIGYDTANLRQYAVAPGTSVRWPRSVFWNNVPVVSPDNQFNFQEVTMSFTPGYENGADISSSSEILNSSLTVTREIGERLRGGSNNAKIYRVFNKAANSVRINVRVNQFSQSDKVTSDIQATTVKYNIYTKPIFSSPGKIGGGYILARQEEITGKVTYGYIRSSLINLTDKFVSEPDFVGWDIKVERQTKESVTSFIRNLTYVDSLTEIFANVLTYPYSAIASSRFSAEFFSQIPERSYHLRGIKCRVPNNYNPILRTYGATRGGSAIVGGDATVDGTTDVWNGVFKSVRQWTDNPAWCFYELLTNRRFGLGEYVTDDMVDKWTLYEIGRYCDVMVPDGYGNVEPRLSCNLYLNSRDDAYKVLNDLANVFRGISYYAGGTVFATQDARKGSDQFYQFTNANVENGEFRYESSSRRVRHTVTLVRYNDKRNLFRPSVEYVEDFDSIRKYGIRELDLTALGCSSRGQAVRFGMWALMSETLETEMVSFMAGMDGAYIRPGDVFKTFDRYRKTNRYAGRASGIFADAGQTVITLDAEVTGWVPTQNYKLSLLTPTYFFDPTQTTLDNSDNIPDIRRNHVQTRAFLGSNTSVVGGNTRITLPIADAINSGNYVVTGNPIWSIEASGALISPTGIPSGHYDFWRTISVTEQQGVKYNVVGLEYSDIKYDAIETGLRFEDITIDDVPADPTNLELFFSSLSTPNVKIIDYKFDQGNTIGVAGFKVFTKTSAFSANDVLEGTYLIDVLPPSIRQGSFVPSTDGTYNFRVYSFNRQNTLSANPATNNIEVSNVNPLRDIIIHSLKLRDDTSSTNAAGTRFTDTFTSINPEFQWKVSYVQQINISTDFTYRITVRQPSSDNLPSKNIYFEKRSYGPTDSPFPTWIFDFDDNIAAIGSLDGQRGPFRDFDVVIEAMTSDGQSSAGGNFIKDGDSKFNNPQGYDIVRATNARPAAITFSITTTDQWLTPDGDIRFVSLQGNQLDEDVKGGYVYTSDQFFTREEALGITPTSASITTTRLDKSLDTITVPARLHNFDKAYAAISIFDAFDEEIVRLAQETETAMQKKLNMSIVQEVLKRGDVSRSLSFVAWIEIGDTVEASLSAGFKGKQFLGTKTVIRGGFPASQSRILIYRYKLTFEKSFTTTNYAHFIYEQPVFTTSHERSISRLDGIFPVLTKATDHVILEVPESSRWFLGVLGP